METPNDDQAFQASDFDWLGNSTPFIFTAFQNATDALGWTQVEKALKWGAQAGGMWGHILSVPDINCSYEPEFNPRVRANFPNLSRRNWQHESIESLTEERKQRWENMKKEWLLTSQSIISKQKDQLRQACQIGIDEWKLAGETTTYTADELVKIWSRQYGDKPVSWLRDQVINQSTIGPFVVEIIKKRKLSFGLKGSSLPKTLSQEQQVLPLSKDKKIRGPYKKPQQEQTLKYYESEVRDAIAKALREGKELNKAKIEKPIMERILNNKNYNERTLRQHLPAKKRTELFGEIYRQILKVNSNIYK